MNEETFILKQLREECGVSVKDMAIRLKVTYQNVQMTETQKNPTWKTIKRFASVLGKSPEIIFKDI